MEKTNQYGVGAVEIDQTTEYPRIMPHLFFFIYYKSI
jgi:hypothetical protein